MKKPKQFGTTLVYIRWFDSAIYKGDPCQPEDLSGSLDNESAGVPQPFAKS